MRIRLAALQFDDRPRVVEDDNMSPLLLEPLWRDHEDTSPYLGYVDLSRPLQSAHGALNIPSTRRALPGARRFGRQAVQYIPSSGAWAVLRRLKQGRGDYAWPAFRGIASVCALLLRKTAHAEPQRRSCPVAPSLYVRLLPQRASRSTVPGAPVCALPTDRSSCPSPAVAIQFPRSPTR